MRVAVVGLNKREVGDPEYADFWLLLEHYNYRTVKHAYISWEVPLTRSELESLLDNLPKSLKVKGRELQDITEEGAKAEGVKAKYIGGVITLEHQEYYRYRPAFIDLWSSINAKRGYSWESNPWVWVIKFKSSA